MTTHNQENSPEPTKPANLSKPNQLGVDELAVDKVEADKLKTDEFEANKLETGELCTDSSTEQPDINQAPSEPASLPKPNKPKPKPKRPLMLWLLIALAMVFLLVIAFGLGKSYGTAGHSPATQSVSTPTGLLPALKNSFKPDPITLQGRIEAGTTNVSTKLPSRVLQIYVKEGQAVKQGDILIKLISPEIEAKKEQAAAMLQSALAAQSAAERGTRQENVESLYAHWQSANAQAQLAKETYQRGEYLYQEGVISRQRRDEMQAAHRSSEQIAHSAHQQYLKAKRGRTSEQKSTADAQVKIAKAAVAEAAALDSETTLHAPIDGSVAKIYVKDSELIMPAVPALSLLQNERTVSISVSEEHYAQLYKQPSLTGYIPALQKSAEFSISHIDSEGEFATVKNTRQTGGYDVRSFKMTLTPTSPISDLKVGMSVVFEFTPNKD